MNSNVRRWIKKMAVRDSPLPQRWSAQHRYPVPRPTTPGPSTAGLSGGLHSHLHQTPTAGHGKAQFIVILTNYIGGGCLWPRVAMVWSPLLSFEPNIVKTDIKIDGVQQGSVFKCFTDGNNCPYKRSTNDGQDYRDFLVGLQDCFSGELVRRWGLSDHPGYHVAPHGLGL